MPKTNSKTIEALEQQITVGKRRLQALWNIYGYTNEEVLAAGVALDEILNEYQQAKAGVRR